MPVSSQQQERGMETPVEKLREIVAGLIDTVAEQGEKVIDAVGLRSGGRHWCPSVDIVESADTVRVMVDLPGVDTSTLDLTLTGNMLTVKGERTTLSELPGETVHRHERETGTFCRSIPLPVAVNSEKVSADSKCGVLTVTLAKEERVKPRHIPVGGTGGTGIP
jgi:HSP20 family protein